MWELVLILLATCLFRKRRFIKPVSYSALNFAQYFKMSFFYSYIKILVIAGLVTSPISVEPFNKSESELKLRISFLWPVTWHGTIESITELIFICTWSVDTWPCPPSCSCETVQVGQLTLCFAMGFIIFSWQNGKKAFLSLAHLPPLDIWLITFMLLTHTLKSSFSVLEGWLFSCIWNGNNVKICLMCLVSMSLCEGRHFSTHCFTDYMKGYATESF